MQPHCQEHVQAANDGHLDDIPVDDCRRFEQEYLSWLRTNRALADTRAAEIREAVAKLARMRLCINSGVQYAVKPALEGPQDHIARALERLRRRRDIVVNRLNAIEGVSCVPPRGAFYAFPRIELESVPSDREFVLRLLREEGVLWVHGEGFGQKPGTKHGRIVFLPPEDVLEESMDRLERFIERNYR